MTALHALSLLPFVPSGSRYEEIAPPLRRARLPGTVGERRLRGFRNGEAQFILQRFEEKAFADNFMVRLNVPDLDAWWREVSARRAGPEVSRLQARPADRLRLG